jgi:hypothetical protein
VHPHLAGGDHPIADQGIQGAVEAAGGLDAALGRSGLEGRRAGRGGWGPGAAGGSDDAAHQGRAPSACPPHRFVCSVVLCDSILKPSVGLVRNLLSKNKKLIIVL